ncbi:MAG: hypothetical protein KDA92_19360 [Planctomycetales bacterium]|nr:hypothetical protein [Planctomycetales bacterium]MCA9166998.1 hypothetical protein [Planctomycetales bacterium]
MNYFAHGRTFVDTPLLLAGTAVPDWLSVVNRRVRARAKSARRFLAARDTRLVQVAAGIVRHHHDDDWFHRTRAFAELSWSFTVEFRDRLPRDDGMRPSFLGHILVELLLDDVLIQQDPSRLHDYYDAMDGLDVEFVAWAVNRIAIGPDVPLERLIPRFSAERFLYDYAEDGKLLFRLNNVMQRVGLPLLPESVCEWFPLARRQVRDRADELMRWNSEIEEPRSL